MCLVVSYTSSLACIRIRYGSVPRVSNVLWLFCWTHSSDPCGPWSFDSLIEKLNFCSPFADGNVKYCKKEIKKGFVSEWSSWIQNYFLLLLLSSYIRTKKDPTTHVSVMSIYNYLRLRGVSIGMLHQSHRCTHLTTQNNLGYCQCYKKHTKNTKKLYYAYLNIIIYYIMGTHSAYTDTTQLYIMRILKWASRRSQTYVNISFYRKKQELGLTHSTWWYTFNSLLFRKK